MDRRGFLGALSAFAATAVIDPEKLLWRQGEKTIFIPPAPQLAFHKDAFSMVCTTADFLKGDVITISGEYKYNPYARTATEMLQQFVVTEDCMLADLKIRPFQWQLGEHAHILSPLEKSR